MMGIYTRLARLERDLRELRAGTNRTGFFTSKPRDVTIASGSVTVVGNFLLLTPESGNTDDLDTIVDDIHGKMILLQNADAAYSITIKDSVGNVILPSGDIVLAGNTQMVALIYDETQTAWISFMPIA